MKDTVNGKRLFYIYLALWFIADILQSVFMEIHADEAYYALYGEFLDWGYYDHPPMVALLTHFSSLLFSGNLGVRFLTALLHVGTVALIWMCTDRPIRDNARNVTLFFILAASMPMFVAYGFITTPDAPLLFFTAAFILTYKRFIKSPDWQTSLMLAVTMAGMMYSKYHGALIILLGVLSNLRLLRTPLFYLSCLVAALLFLPHIIWQISAGFPSLNYHLIARNQPFSWLFPLEYIPNQLAVFNPFMLALAICLCWKHRHTRSQFERTLIFLSVGFLAFFWLMTAKGHAEPHWTVAASIPMLLLSFSHVATNTSISLYVKRFILPMTLLVIVARIILCTGLLPERIGFNGKASYSRAIHSLCGDTPVIFTGSFQQASLYRFFNDSDAALLSSLHSRRTQFDILRPDTALNGSPAYIIGMGDEHTVGRHTFRCYHTDSLQAVNRIAIHVDSVDYNTGNIAMSLTNPYPVNIRFSHTEFPVEVKVAYLIDNEYRLAGCRMSIADIELPTGATIRLHGVADLPADLDGRAIPAVMCLQNKICTSVNSQPFTIE